jgi:dUTP pyrophosphatase
MSYNNEQPTFKFALREDIKDDKRFLPSKSEPNAVGFDVRAAPKNHKDIILRAGQYFKIELGFRMFAPEGWWVALHPRSSSFIKKYMHNLIGVIDTDFHSELVFAGQYIPDLSSMGNDLRIEFGDRIGQILPIRKENMDVIEINNVEYDELCVKKNPVRKGGIGSTGDK